MNDTLVTVRTFYQVPLAGMAKALLDEAGVECWLADVYAGGLYFPATFGGIKLQVRSKDEAAALQALEQLDAPRGDESETDSNAE